MNTKKFPNSYSAFLVLLIPSFTVSQSCHPSLVGGQDGDIILGGLFNIHNGGMGADECGRTINEDGIQRLEAFFYVMDAINSGNTIPGVMFGSAAYDSCERPLVAVDKTLEFLGQAEREGYNELCPKAPKYIGMVGPLTSEENEEVGTLLTSAKMLHLSYSATSKALGNRKRYPYFRRVVPDSSYTNRVLLDILKKLTWSRITVIASNDADAQDRKQELFHTAGVNGICVDHVIIVSRTTSNLDGVISQLLEAQEKGVDGVVFLTSHEVTHFIFSALHDLRPSQPGINQLKVVMGTPFLDDPAYASLLDVIKGVVSFTEFSGFGAGFQAYFTSLEPETNPRNPWFKRYWEEKYNCTMGVTCETKEDMDDNTNYKQAMYVTQTAVAVYSLAYALKAIHQDLCGGTTGLCAEMRRLSADRVVHYIEKQTFSFIGQDVTFDETGEYVDQRYQIFNVQLDGISYKQQQVGLWSPRDGIRMSGGFKLYNISSDFRPDVRSQAKSHSHVTYTCENPPYDDTLGWVEQGHILLEGIFDVHEQGLGEAECGQLLGSGLQAVEAMLYAIDMINNDPNILPEIKLGAAVIDSCRSTNRAVRQTLALVRGKLQATSTETDSLPITAIVGGASSDVTMAIAEKVTPYKITQISYSSTAMELSDTNKFPYFMRTVGSDKAQIKALVDVIKTFNWSYVKVIFSNNEYGNAAIREFLHLAAQNKICVATQIKLEHYFSTDMVAMRNIVRYYFMEAFLDARVVVMFTTDTDAHAIMKALQSVMGDEMNDLIWLATDYWGSKESVTEDVEEIAKGALTLDFQSNYIGGFMNHFRGLSPGENKRNPWFDEFWQTYFECHTSSFFVDDYDKSCSSRETLANEHIRMATEVPYVIDAVYSIALALERLLMEHCGVTNHLCPAAKDNMDQLTDYIRNLRFYNSITNLNVSYDVLGDGIPRYKVLNYIWHNDSNSFIYKQVGTWEDDILEMHTTDVYSYAGENGSLAKYSDVLSECNGPLCMCTSETVTDLKFQLQYARLTLLGYFPVHKRSANGVFCSQIRPEEGFLPLMAFKYAITRVNNEASLLGNVSLGYMLFDTCSEPDHATLVFDAFDKTLRFFTQPPQVPVITYVHAFIGGHEDIVSKALNKANFNGQRLVQISAASADDELSDGGRYPYFLRTKAPESNLAKALVGLLQAMGWSYVTAISPSTQSGRALAEKLSNAIIDNGACLAAREEIDPLNPNPDQYETALRNLDGIQGAVGLILLTENSETRQLLLAAKRLNLIGRFVWIGTDHWGSNYDLVSDVTDIARGAFSLSADSGEDHSFVEYMQRVTHDSDLDNPWLQEFWEDHFGCDLKYKPGSHRVCSGTESLNLSLADNIHVINTINAVYSYARGLTRLFKERCGGMVMPPCDAISGGERTSQLVYQYIKQEQFIGADNHSFSFTPDGNGGGRYRILNYALLRQENGSRLIPAYIEVGQWTGSQMNFNRSLVHIYDSKGNRALPESECPSVIACNCTIRQGPLDTVNVPLSIDAHRQVWGILVITFSLIGIVFAIVTMMFFIFKFRHPVVLGSTCSLSILLLVGIVLLYLLNFAFMLSDTWTTCGLRRFGLGVIHTLVFASLLVKVIRIRRIWNKANLAIKPAFISGPSQTAVALFLVAVQIVLASEWIVITPPSVSWTLVDVNKGIGFPIYNVSWFCVHSKESLVTSLVFVFLLLLVTFVLAIRARQATEFQREALCILISSVLSSAILVTWLCVYMLADPKFSTPAVCIGITVTASTVFVVVFVPKMLVLTASQPSGGVDISNNLDYDGQYAVPKKRGRDVTNSTGIDIVTPPRNYPPQSFKPVHEMMSTAL